MLRAMRKFAGRYRERVLSLVMLPVFFLSAFPQAVCICADGHRELFCTAVAPATLTINPKASCCTCSCCGAAQTSNRKSCCEGGQTASSEAGWLSLKRPCCKLVCEVPAPAAKPNTNSLPTWQDVVVAASPEIVLPAAGCDAIQSLSRGNRPPPLDLSIVYLHLTI